MRLSTKSAYFKAGFAVTAWGASFIATKIALQDISPIVVVWLRFTIGVAILGAATFVRKEFSIPTLKDFSLFAVLGLIGITFHQWLQSKGLVTSEASTTAWIVATTPVFIAILSWALLREKVRWTTAAGIVMAAIGVILVVSKGDFSLVITGNFGVPGDLLILISAPNWAVFSVLSRRGLSKHPAVMMMFYVMTIGWLFSSIQFLMGTGYQEIAYLSTPGWLGIAFLGIFSTGLAYIFWYDALQVLPATQVGVFLYFEPLIAVFAANLILAEVIIPIVVLGGIIILLGVWMVNKH